MRLAIIGLLLLMSCATEGKFRAKMDSWKGRKGDDVVQELGTPLRTVDLKSGGRSYFYRDTGVCTFSINTDKHDIIQSWTSQGDCIED